VPKYVTYTGGGRRYWRLGGPLTAAHEKDAVAVRRARPTGPIGRFVLRMLGGQPKSKPPAPP
jgi:hypothetical protein